MDKTTYEDWLLIAKRCASYAMPADEVPADIWREHYDNGTRPSKAAAIEIDKHLEALRFKHV